MCIAVTVPAGKQVTPDQLRACWRRNPDGAGFAFVRDGQVEVSKGFMKLQALEEAWAAAQEANPNSPFLLHFRIRTSGAVSSDNTHPFKLDTGAALIHNGSFSGFDQDWNTGPSDTALFAKHYTLTFDKDFVLRHREALEKAIGSYNKVAFLFPDSDIVRLNASNWIESDGVMFSNSTFRPYAGY